MNQVSKATAASGPDRSAMLIEVDASLVRSIELLDALEIALPAVHAQLALDLLRGEAIG